MASNTDSKLSKNFLTYSIMCWFTRMKIIARVYKILTFSLIQFCLPTIDQNMKNTSIIKIPVALFKKLRKKIIA